MGSFFDVSRTVLGPLTTTYTPPASCFTAQVDYLTYETAWQGQSCGTDAPRGGPTDGLSCWPPITAGAPSPQPALHGWGFYSPGIQCPAGFQTACHATAGGPAEWSTQFHMQAGETAVGCCPPNFTCYFSADSGQTCRSIAGDGDTVTVQSCSVGSTFKPTALTLPFVTQASVTDTASSAATPLNTLNVYTVYAPMIEIRWRSNDRVASETSSSAKSTASIGSASTSASASVSAAGVGQTAQPTTGSSNNKDSNTGLSTSAKAAIGVVIPVIVLGVLAVVALFLLRRRKNKIKNNNNTAEPRYEHLQQRQELESTQVHEMAANSGPMELDNKASTLYELPGGPTKFA